MILSEEQVRTKHNNEVSLFEKIWTNDGLTWCLMPGKIKEWPNGNPHEVMYKDSLGNRMVIWLNEVGDMIYNRIFV